MTDQPTTPIPSLVDDARRILVAVLAADPMPDDAQAVAAALAVLVDVDPPYPPLGLEDDPTEPDVGIPSVAALLTRAADEATAIPDLCRLGETLTLLHRAPSVRPATAPR